MKLLRVKEVMIKLGISRGKVYQMIREGKIPSVNIDGCIRIPETLLDDMVYQQLLKGAGKDRGRVERIIDLFGDRAGRGEDKKWPVVGT